MEMKQGMVTKREPLRENEFTLGDLSTESLKRWGDDELLLETEILAKKEREITGKVLRLLLEIDRRRLYCTRECGSLYQYAIKVLKYPEDQAWRRVKAMELLKEIPAIEEKVNGGELSLSHLSLAQALFTREEKAEKPVSAEEKKEILAELENTSKREAEKILAERSTTPPPPIERIKMVSKKTAHISFTASVELLEKIEKLKGLLAHKNPSLKLEGLVDQLCDLGLKKWDKSLAPEVRAPAKGKQVNDQRAEIGSAEKKMEKFEVTSISGNDNDVLSSDKLTEKIAPAQRRENQKVPNSRKNRIPMPLQRRVWRRDAGQCINCKSRYAVEIDHLQPKALGGEDLLENLRLLCRKCNQRAAIESMGVEKMSRFLNELAVRRTWG